MKLAEVINELVNNDRRVWRSSQTFKTQLMLSKDWVDSFMMIFENSNTQKYELKGIDFRSDDWELVPVEKEYKAWMVK